MDFQDIAQIAQDCGLSALGVTSGDAMEGEIARLSQWQADGFAASMEYMLRDPAKLCSPRNILPDCNSILTFAVKYESTPHPRFDVGSGRVARYAWGLDYHIVLRQRLDRFVEVLRERTGTQCTVRAFSDSVPLLERPLAMRSGLGFIGKNTLLITPGEGSLFFLAELLTDLVVDGAPLSQTKGRCGSCRRCQDRCPTGALDAAHRLDARRCISYLTIEKRDALTVDERRYLGEWIFGCDLCQDVCPFNHRAISGDANGAQEEFKKEAGVGPLLSLAVVLSIRTNSEFKRRFENTPLLRARRPGLLRNAAVVAANTGATNIVPQLIAAIEEDASPLVRQHCAWALNELRPKLDGALQRHAIGALDRARCDPAPEVRGELMREDGASCFT